jgi:hypothetical protein
MNELVCATRGGEGSRAVQLAAIDQARETGHPLVFLYVVSLASLGEIENGMETAVREEMLWLGKAVLQVARARARQTGVEASLVVKAGDMRTEICSYLTDSQASLLLLGAPRAATTTVFGDDPVERFANSIHESTGVPVMVVRPGSAGARSYITWEDTRKTEK